MATTQEEKVIELLFKKYIRLTYISAFILKGCPK